MGPAPTRRDAVLTAYAKSLIQFKARQLCRKPGFSRSDEEDLVQELTLRLLQKGERYDPGRGASLSTFADRVINSGVKMILRERHALKRAAGFKSKSLDQPMIAAAEGSTSVGDALSQADQHRRTGTDEAPAVDVVADREAVAAVIQTLPPFLAEVARRLQETGNISAVAKALGLSRVKVYAATRVIKAHLERAGFGKS